MDFTLRAMMRHFRELSVAGALLLILIVLAIAAPGFYQAQPLLSLATREAPKCLSMNQPRAAVRTGLLS